MTKLNNYISKNVSKFFKKVDKNTVYIGITVIAIIATGILIFERPSSPFSLSNIFGPSDERIAKKAVDYINNNKLSRTPASLVSVSNDSGLIKIKIKIGTNEYDSYVTKNGKLLFPQAFDLTKAGTTSSSGNSQNQNTGGSQ